MHSTGRTSSLKVTAVPGRLDRINGRALSTCVIDKISRMPCTYTTTTLRLPNQGREGCTEQPLRISALQILSLSGLFSQTALSKPWE